MRTRPACRCAAISTVLPRGAKSIALSSRLATACRSRNGSPSTTTAGSTSSRASETPAASASVSTCATASSTSATSANGFGLLDALAVFDRGQRQQLVDHLRQPVALRADGGDEARAVGLGQRGLEQLGAAADRRQRTLQLMRERVHVLLDVLLAL